MNERQEAMYRERIMALEMLVARLLREHGVAEDLVHEWESGAADVHFRPGETLNSAAQITRKITGVERAMNRLETDARRD